MNWICHDCKHRELKGGDDPVYNYHCAYNEDDYPFVASCPHYEKKEKDGST